MAFPLPSDPRHALMLLSSIVEPGDNDLADLVDETGPIDAVARLWTGDVSGRLARLTAPAIAAVPNPAVRAAQLAEATAACGSRVLIPGDPDWPVQLNDLAGIGTAGEPHLRPPRCLWVRGEGDLAVLCQRSVAIVGARAASDYGRHVAETLAAHLTAAGWTIISGGALGIDYAAHHGSAAHGGPTVAVLACGVDQPYPLANRAMFGLIVDKGLLVSEWPPGSSPAPQRFLARNRIIASLAAGLVVVEAAQRSGSVNAARYAHELGRVLMFTPGPVTSAQSRGVHQLARRPWGARLVTCAKEVVEDLTASAETTVSPPRWSFDDLTDTEALVVETLPRGYLVDDARLAAAAGLPLTTTTETLERLQRYGWAEKHDDRWRLHERTTP